MNKLYFFILLFSISLCAQAEVIIMVCNANGSVCNPYATLDDAVANANNGDYIYLPGGIFVLSGIINKEIHIVGAGYNQDSSSVTNYTLVNSSIQLSSNASNSSFEGFYLAGNFVTTGTDTVSNIIFKRLNLNTCTSKYKNCQFIEDVIRGGLGNNSYFFTNILLSNCVVDGSLNTLVYSTFNNCFFSYNGYINGWGQVSAVLVGCEFSTVRNSIFLNYASFTSNLTAIHNLFFTASGTITQDINNQFSSCALNYANCPATYQNNTDYHLLVNSPGKNAGVDGTDIGIYGGLFPWNEGGVPSNPHIYYKNLPNQIIGNQLPVNIKVRTGN